MAPPRKASVPLVPTQPLQQLAPSIRSCRVTSFDKIRGRWCFVVHLTPVRPVRLGNALVPSYVVYRTWDDFLELEKHLLGAWEALSARSAQSIMARSSSVSGVHPHTPPLGAFASLATPPSPEDARPTNLHTLLPRLSRKMHIFVSRTTHLARQDELDMFVRRLFSVEILASTKLISTFFGLWAEDHAIGQARGGGPAASVSSSSSSSSSGATIGLGLVLSGGLGTASIGRATSMGLLLSPERPTFDRRVASQPRASIESDSPPPQRPPLRRSDSDSDTGVGAGVFTGLTVRNSLVSSATTYNLRSSRLPAGVHKKRSAPSLRALRMTALTPEPAPPSSVQVERIAEECTECDAQRVLDGEITPEQTIQDIKRRVLEPAGAADLEPPPPPTTTSRMPLSRSSSVLSKLSGIASPPSVEVTDESSNEATTIDLSAIDHALALTLVPERSLPSPPTEAEASPTSTVSPPPLKAEPDAVAKKRRPTMLGKFRSLTDLRDSFRSRSPVPPPPTPVHPTFEEHAAAALAADQARSRASIASLRESSEKRLPHNRRDPSGHSHTSSMSTRSSYDATGEYFSYQSAWGSHDTSAASPRDSGFSWEIECAGEDPSAAEGGLLSPALTLFEYDGSPRTESQPPTPRTPLTPLPIGGGGGLYMTGAKFYVDDTGLHASNTVPLPPMFAPPMSIASSIDSPRSSTSTDALGNRAGVRAQRALTFSGSRPPPTRVLNKQSSHGCLKSSAQASLHRGFIPPVPALPASATAQSPLTLKIIYVCEHARSNVVMRVPRTDLTLAQLRARVEAKFADNDVKLHAHWLLATHGDASGWTTTPPSPSTAGFAPRPDSPTPSLLELAAATLLVPLSPFAEDAADLLPLASEEDWRAALPTFGEKTTLRVI